MIPIHKMPTKSNFLLNKSIHKGSYFLFIATELVNNNQQVMSLMLTLLFNSVCRVVPTCKQ